MNNTLKLKQSAWAFLAAAALALAGILLKVNTYKTSGDILLVLSTIGFYYFVYRAFLKKKTPQA